MAARKTDERFELVEKEIKEVRVSMEKGIGDMEKRLGEVRVELSQNRTDLFEIRRLMEEQVKLLSASTLAPEKTVAQMATTEEDHRINHAGEGREMNRAGDHEPNRIGDNRKVVRDGEVQEANRASNRVEIRAREERLINPRVS